MVVIGIVIGNKNSLGATKICPNIFDLPTYDEMIMCRPLAL